MIMDGAEQRQQREECAIPPSAMCCLRCSHLDCERSWTLRHDSTPPAAATTAAASVAARKATAAAGTSSDTGRAGRSRRRQPRGPTLAFALSCVLILAILDLNACSALFFNFEGGPKVSPRFIKALKNVTVQLGKPFNLTCTARAGPFQILIMLHNGQQIQPHFLVDKSKLESTYDDQEVLYSVESAKISDIGVYECRVEHNNGENTSVTSLVDVIGEGKPVLRPMHDQEITQGSSVTLECVADGSPHPTIRWLLPAHVQASSRVHVDNALGTVTIIHAGVQHRGDYVCQASNSHGTVQHAVRLDVFVLGVPHQPTRRPVLDVTMTKQPSLHKCAKCKTAGHQDTLGITDRDLVIIIACSGAIIVIACVSTLVCYVQTIRRPQRPKAASPPTSQTHTDSTTGTIATQSPSQTLRYDSDDKHGTCL